jgi:hypothetical protein
VTFTPTATGRVDGTLHLVTNDTTGAYDVALHGEGR